MRTVTVFFGKNGFGFVALLSFDEAQLLQVAGKSGLGDAHFLLSKPAAELFLADDGLAADQPQYLTMTKCFTGAHDLYKYTASCIFMQLFLNETDLFADSGRKRLAGGIWGVERGYAGFATFSGRTLDFPGQEWLPFLLTPVCVLHGYTVQSNGM